MNHYLGLSCSHAHVYPAHLGLGWCPRVPLGHALGLTCYRSGWPTGQAKKSWIFFSLGLGFSLISSSIWTSFMELNQGVQPNMVISNIVKNNFDLYNILLSNKSILLFLKLQCEWNCRANLKIPSFLEIEKPMEKKYGKPSLINSYDFSCILCVFYVSV